MRSRRGRLLIWVVTLVAVACGGDGGGESSTTMMTTIATSTTTTPSPSTTATLSDLTGTWGNDEVVLEVNSGGEFILARPDQPETPVMGGFVARDGDQFSFVTSTSGECPGQTGVYRASLAGGSLTLILVDDPCQMRVAGFGEDLVSIE